MRDIMASRRAASQDLADEFPNGFDDNGVPKPADPARREQYRNDLVGFLGYYFPNVFY